MRFTRLLKMKKMAIDTIYEKMNRLDVFCHGKLLQTVQLARIFKNSRTFVDMKLKLHPSHLLFNFDRFMKHYKHKPNKAKIKRFVFQHFHSIESEFEPWMPTDYKEEPKMIQKIKDEDLKNWAYELNQMWPMLGKKVKDEVHVNEELYSIIYLKHGMILPGSKYRNFYYWDTYWIIIGLIQSEMLTTVRHMLDNMCDLVNKFGHMPHGNRIYFLNRSQPPLFIPMIKQYYNITGDLEYVRKNINIAEKELNYWLTNHIVDINKDGKRFTLAVYGCDTVGPRPEHYLDDIRMAEYFDEDAKEDFYSEIKAAVESGWNFSTRWIEHQSHKFTMNLIKTRSIVPVDLNAILFGNMVILSEFFKLLNDDRHQHYRSLANQWLWAVTTVLWDNKRGSWFDYDLETENLRDSFYPSNLVPLWTNCYREVAKDRVVDKVVNYLKTENAILRGGIPSSFIDSGYKWDFPYVWSPLQHVIVEGLSQTRKREAEMLAFAIAQKFIRNAYFAYENYGYMYQRYLAHCGPAGQSGGFDAQVGYGWSNGVCLCFLEKYGDKLTLCDYPKPVITSSNCLEFSQNNNSLTTDLG